MSVPLSHIIPYILCPSSGVAIKPLWWLPGGHIVYTIVYFNHIYIYSYFSGRLRNVFTWYHYSLSRSHTCLYLWANRWHAFVHFPLSSHWANCSQKIEIPRQRVLHRSFILFWCLGFKNYLKTVVGRFGLIFAQIWHVSWPRLLSFRNLVDEEPLCECATFETLFISLTWRNTS